MKVIRTGQGDGPRVLLVHGNDLCAEFYLPLAAALATHGVAACLVTLPGFHREAPLAQPGWTALVDALAALCATERPDVVAGHSMGGLFALLLAARSPPGVRGLALLEPAIFPGRVVAAVAARRYLSRVVHAPRATAQGPTQDPVPFQNDNGGQRRIAHPARFPPAAFALYDEVRATSDRATAHALFSTLAAQVPLPFADVHVPTLLVRGARSGLLSRVMMLSLERALHTRAHVVPDAAHWLAHEQDDVVAGHVADFTRALPPAAR